MCNVNVIVKHDVSIQNLGYDVGYYEDVDINVLEVNEAREKDEEEEEIKEEEEELEDFISDEDDELAVGDIFAKGIVKGGDRLICLVKSRPTPSNTILSPNPSPNPSPTPIPNHNSPPFDSYVSPFSSSTIQTPVFTFDRSPQHDMVASRSINHTIGKFPKS
ncbi:hypothetical protein Cgig2_017252 [Carnegiea gigantea]|uniref:Uncharacterized protein n=1 Tax=Carnegiea gigantea TaxID=171969 RepID=A0A9Q1GV70_9CARY|nr:hypothetical protein Cgig2_017252 [Carnegiea gigantea]